MRWVLLLVGLTACQIDGTFVCGVDDACREGTKLGTCEDDGYCSFGDDGCPSGRRYAGNAGNDVAGTCVAGEAPPLTCLDKWRTGVVRFGPLVDLGINSTMSDRDPSVSSNDLQLVFSSNRTGGAGDDVFTAMRTDVSMPFSGAGRVTSMSSPASDSKYSQTANGLLATLSTDRPGGEGGNDVWRATRTMAGGALSSFDQISLGEVNTADNEQDAILSPDGLRLYLTLAGDQGQRLVIASRPALADNFAAPVMIPVVNGGTGDADPAVSRDELVLVFTSLRSGAGVPGGSNLWYARRAAITDAWLPPVLVPDVNASADEGDPFLSDDGCTLYFARAVSSTNWDLVAAPLTP